MLQGCGSLGMTAAQADITGSYGALRCKTRPPPYHRVMSSPAPDTSRIGRSMIVIMWIVLIGIATWYFNGFLDAAHNPNRDVVTRVTAGGAAVTELKRNRYGHYVASGQINGQPVRFLLDTGASDVNIPEKVARRLGLEPGAAHYASTANGTILVYATRLSQVQLGDIVVSDVRASINPNMEGDDVLLGMTFLKDLEIVQRGDTLTLKQL